MKKHAQEFLENIGEYFANIGPVGQIAIVAASMLFVVAVAHRLLVAAGFKTKK
jgi:hypothetical protein